MEPPATAASVLRSAFNPMFQLTTRSRGGGGGGAPEAAAAAAIVCFSCGPTQVSGASEAVRGVAAHYRAKGEERRCLITYGSSIPRRHIRSVVKHIGTRRPHIIVITVPATSIVHVRAKTCKS